MSKYKFVERYPIDGIKGGKRANNTLYEGTNKQLLLDTMRDWSASGNRKPWAGYSIYRDGRRIGAHQL